MRARRPALLRLASAAIAVAALCIAFPAAAAAHSALESSNPAADSSVPTSPRHIVLTFSEAPDVKLSLVRLLDGDGAVVPGVSAPQAVRGDKQSLRVAPSTPLPDGTYTVNWRAVSAVDGHVESGAFAFGVGRAAGEAVVVELLHTSPWARALADAGRWLLYAALVVLIGAASTSLLVYGGRLPSGGVLVLKTTVAFGVVALGMLVWAEKMLVGAPSLLPLFLTREGQYLLALGVALLLCIGAVALVDLWPARWSLWALGVTGIVAVLVHVLAGHAAAPSSVWLLNVVVQWVHMAAVGVWVGGLFWLLLGLRGRDHEQRVAAVAVFTRVATATLVVVLATGLARALVEVGSVSALFDTRYGITLIVKVVLVAVLVGLGALNHFFWVPAVRGDGGEPAERRFGLNSRGELAVALCVLAATAVLSGLAPGATATAASGTSASATRVTASGSDYATSVRAELTLTPGVAGRNGYKLWADDYDTGDPLTTVTDVRMQCSLPARPSMTAVTVPLRRAEDGSWTGSGLDFSVPGRWKVDVYVQEKTQGTTVPLELTITGESAP
jgi:copper transport protein